jgi:hypothetical protein
MNGDALSRVAAAALATLTAFALTACGPDEAPSANAGTSASNATAPAQDKANSFAQAAAVIQPGPGAALTPHQETSAGAAANINVTAAAQAATQAASETPALPDSVADNPVASVVASLAADSQQVTPVIHAAPGDDSY